MCFRGFDAVCVAFVAGEMAPGWDKVVFVDSFEDLVSVASLLFVVFYEFYSFIV